MNLKNLSARELHEKLLGLVGDERRLALIVLGHLREVEARRLYAERGHSSLFDYCVSELKYSEAAAMRRISAMRALKVLPELKEQVESGELKVTQLAALQSFVRMEAKAGKTYSVPETRALFQAACGKSTRETEKLLAEKNPEYLNREKVRVVNATQTQLSFTADDALMQEIQAVRDRFAHQLPVAATLAEVVRFMAKSTLLSAPEKRSVRKQASQARSGEKQSALPLKKPSLEDENKKAKPPQAHSSASAVRADTIPAPAPRSRIIPAAVKRAIWKRDEGRCQFVSRVTGRKCLSRHRIQCDHIAAFALGGSSTDPDNLRLLCFSHDQYEARRVFGDRKGGRATRADAIFSTATASSSQFQSPRNIGAQD